MKLRNSGLLSRGLLCLKHFVFTVNIVFIFEFLKKKKLFHEKALMTMKKTEENGTDEREEETEPYGCWCFRPK